MTNKTADSMDYRTYLSLGKIGEKLENMANTDPRYKNRSECAAALIELAIKSKDKIDVADDEELRGGSSYQAQLSLASAGPLLEKFAEKKGFSTISAAARYLLARGMVIDTPARAEAIKKTLEI